MRRRPVLAGLLGLVVVLVVVEVGARVLAPHLPEPRLYTDDTTRLKVLQLEDRAERADCLDLVLVGNSMTRDDLDPGLLADGIGGDPSVYNAALDAATPVLLEQWVEDEVLDRVDAGHVVVGISSFDLNDGARIARSAVDAYEAAPMTRQDLLGRLQRPLLTNLAAYRHRSELRTPEVVWDSVGRLVDGEEAERIDASGIDGLVGPDGQGLSRRDLTYTGGAASQALVRAELLNDYRVGGAQQEALGDLVAGLDDAGVGVTVVALPVTEDFASLHPAGEADMAEALALAEATTEASGGTFLDFHDWGRDELFADTHHLNGEGADRFSADLAEALPPGIDRACSA